VTHEELRQFVRHRAGARCEYCHLPDVLPAVVPFHLEHIVARQHHGKTEPSNLAWACQRCNAKKGPNLSGHDPDSGVVVLLFHPRRDLWEDHFRFDDLLIEGITSTGTATVRLLEMNALERIRWRAIFRRHGLF